MTDTNNTANIEITWELDEIISNFETLIDLNCLSSTNEDDMEVVAKMTHIYGNVLIENLHKAREKMKKLERFYNANNHEKATKLEIHEGET